MRNLFYALLMFFAFTACKNKASKPKDLLPESKLIPILVDLHLAEGGVDNKVFYDDSITVDLQAEYDNIFREHNITEEHFKQSFQYYQTKPAELGEMYQKVLDSLEALERKLQNIELFELKDEPSKLQRPTDKRR